MLVKLRCLELLLQLQVQLLLIAFLSQKNKNNFCLLEAKECTVESRYSQVSWATKIVYCIQVSYCYQERFYTVDSILVGPNMDFTIKVAFTT